MKQYLDKTGLQRFLNNLKNTFVPFNLPTSKTLTLAGKTVVTSSYGIQFKKQGYSYNAGEIKANGPSDLYMEADKKMNMVGSEIFIEATDAICLNSYETYIESDYTYIDNPSFLSDSTLKENIDVISNSDIDKVDNVTFKRFNFIKDENDTVKYGVIAQDLEAIGLDNLVSTSHNNVKAVDYISLLVLEIESLKRKIESLETQISGTSNLNN